MLLSYIKKFNPWEENPCKIHIGYCECTILYPSEFWAASNRNGLQKQKISSFKEYQNCLDAWRSKNRRSREKEEGREEGRWGGGEEVGGGGGGEEGEEKEKEKKEEKREKKRRSKGKGRGGGGRKAARIALRPCSWSNLGKVLLPPDITGCTPRITGRGHCMQHTWCGHLQSHQKEFSPCPRPNSFKSP